VLRASAAIDPGGRTTWVVRTRAGAGGIGASEENSFGC